MRFCSRLQHLRFLRASSTQIRRFAIVHDVQVIAIDRGKEKGSKGEKLEERMSQRNGKQPELVQLELNFYFLFPAFVCVSEF